MLEERLAQISRASTQRPSQPQPETDAETHGHEGKPKNHLITMLGFILLTVWSRERWRYTGPFTRFNRFKGSFPGLGIATVAFAAYCGYEHFFLQDDHHHDAGHSEGH